jgi:hypothetical protein
LAFFCYRRIPRWRKLLLWIFIGIEEYQDGENSFCEFFGLVPFLQLAIHILLDLLRKRLLWLSSYVPNSLAYRYGDCLSLGRYPKYNSIWTFTILTNDFREIFLSSSSIKQGNTLKNVNIVSPEFLHSQ